MRALHATILFLLPLVRAGFNRSGHFNPYTSPQIINSVGSVQFGGRNISISEHAKTNWRYFYQPLAFLLKDTGRVTEEFSTGQIVMGFDVLIWSKEAQEVVYRYIKENVNNAVTMDGVRPWLVERMRLVWRANDTMCDGYNLDEYWQTTTSISEKVSFLFTCYNKTMCYQLQTAMKTKPSMFRDLVLEYMFSAKSSFRLDVTTTTILSGRTFKAVESMTGGGVVRYINADDANSIALETSKAVISNNPTDFDDVSTRVTDIVLREIEKVEVSSKDIQPHNWESVFWNPIWSRPDRLSKSLNKIFEKDNTGSTKLRLRKDALCGEAGINAEVTIPGIFDSGGGLQLKVNKKDVLRSLGSSADNVEWDGETFRIKPVTLFRLNLAKILQRTNYVSVRIDDIPEPEIVNRLPLVTDYTDVGNQTIAEASDWVEATICHPTNSANAGLANEVYQLTMEDQQL